MQNNDNRTPLAPGAPQGRPAFDRAWEELQPRIAEVLKMPDTDEAGVESALLRIAAYLHIRNGQNHESFVRMALTHFRIMQDEVEAAARGGNS